jgi:hypothetical protein
MLLIDEEELMCEVVGVPRSIIASVSTGARYSVTFVLREAANG